MAVFDHFRVVSQTSLCHEFVKRLAALSPTPSLQAPQRLTGPRSVRPIGIFRVRRAAVVRDVPGVVAGAAVAGAMHLATFDDRLVAHECDFLAAGAGGLVGHCAEFQGLLRAEGDRCVPGANACRNCRARRPIASGWRSGLSADASVGFSLTFKGDDDRYRAHGECCQNLQRVHV